MKSANETHSERTNIYFAVDLQARNPRSRRQLDVVGDSGPNLFAKRQRGITWECFQAGIDTSKHARRKHMCYRDGVAYTFSTYLLMQPLACTHPHVGVYMRRHKHTARKRVRVRALAHGMRAGVHMCICACALLHPCSGPSSESSWARIHRR